MSNISQIKTPNGSLYDIKDSYARKWLIYPVKGTQITSTGSWTGELDVPELYDGLTIAYYLPYEGSGNATLNLTLSDGTQTTPINVYYANNTRASTQYGAGSTITLTYWSAGSISINGTATTDNRWTRSNYDSSVPLQTKTYTGVYCTANDDPNGYLYFGRIQVPQDNITNQILIKFRIRATIPGLTGANAGIGNEISTVEYHLRKDVMLWYRTENTIANTSYRPYYGHVVYRGTEAGLIAGYGHLLGLRFYSSYNPHNASYARNITIEILETENCTVEFFDSMILYANASGTGSTNFVGRNEYDGATQGDTHTGDRNDVNYYNRIYYTNRKTVTNLYRYQIMLSSRNKRYLLPVNAVNNSVATNKELTTERFDPFGEIYFYSSTSTVNADGNIPLNILYRQFIADLRYSFNVGGYNTTGILKAMDSLYLVAVPQDDGTAVLNINPLAFDLPTTEDGLLYIYLGQIHDEGTSYNPYRVDLTLHHPVYRFINGNVHCYSDDAATASNFNTAKTIALTGDVTGSASSDGSSGWSISTTYAGILGVGKGGTGQTSFTAGAALIGNGGNAITTKAIKNNTSVGGLGWSSSSNDNVLITSNTLAYWNGAYTGTSSNLEYVKAGKLGDVVTHNMTDFITTSGGIIDGSLSATDLTAGSLVVTGSGSFANGIYTTTLHGSLDGTLSTSRKIDGVDFNAAADISRYGICSNTASTVAKTVSINGITQLATGTIIYVYMTNSNTASDPTLNVNSLGAKSIYRYGTTSVGASESSSWYAGSVVTFIYSGSAWYIADFTYKGQGEVYTAAYCDTAAGTAAKVASCANHTLLTRAYLYVTMVNANTKTGALTLNINSSGAKPIYINGTASSSTNYTLPAGTYLVYTDNTNYYFRTDGRVQNFGTSSTFSAWVTGTTLTLNWNPA